MLDHLEVNKMWILVVAGVVLVDAQGYNYPRSSAALSPNQYNYQIPTTHDRYNGDLYPQNQYNNQYLNQQNQFNVQTPLSPLNLNQFSKTPAYNVASTSYYQQTCPTNQQSVYTDQSSNNQQVSSEYNYNTPQSNDYSIQPTGQNYAAQASNYNQQSTYNTQNHQQVSSNYNLQSSPLGQANFQSVSYSYNDNSNLATQNHALSALRPAYPQSEAFGAVLHQPVTTKHIYFHIPPADIEEPKQALPRTPQKHYKIIFIKVPSQESRNSVFLQQKLQEAATEEKTLIYVLVKKPETQEIKAAETVTTKPEVFYVKYNHKTPLKDVMSQIIE